MCAGRDGGVQACASVFCDAKLDWLVRYEDVPTKSRREIGSLSSQHESIRLSRARSLSRSSALHAITKTPVIALDGKRRRRSLEDDRNNLVMHRISA
jgi:hypothetical protein